MNVSKTPQTLTEASTSMKDYIITHKCGRNWKISTDLPLKVWREIIYCPSCKESEGFKVELVIGKKTSTDSKK